MLLVVSLGRAGCHCYVPTGIGSFGAASKATNVVMRIVKCWSMVVMGSCADTAAGSLFVIFGCEV